MIITAADFRYHRQMSKTVAIRFYAELNDFLPAEDCQTVIMQDIDQPRSVKDLFESLGVPHTEVDLIIVNGAAVDFNYLVQGGERISIYPAFTQLDISPLVHCQPEDPREICFVLDTHLGKLAAYLRMMGFDCLYSNAYNDPELAEISARDDRILLTCDRQLLMRNSVTRGYFVRSRKPRKQLNEIDRRYGLVSRQHPFTRCMACNGLIHPVDKRKIETLLKPDTFQYYDRFFQCERCKKVYWEGSHYRRMQAIIENINRDSGFSSQ
jgi:uncharacterized protein with PIN domain